jgi:ribonuclease HI
MILEIFFVIISSFLLFINYKLAMSKSKEEVKIRANTIYVSSQLWEIKIALPEDCQFFAEGYWRYYPQLNLGFFYRPDGLPKLGVDPIKNLIVGNVKFLVTQETIKKIFSIFDQSSKNSKDIERSTVGTKTQVFEESEKDIKTEEVEEVEKVEDVEEDEEVEEEEEEEDEEVEEDEEEEEDEEDEEEEEDEEDEEVEQGEEEEDEEVEEDEEGTTELIVYCDGSAAPNPGIGGWAAVSLDAETEKEIKTVSGGHPNTGNGKMELMGAIGALSLIPVGGKATIYSDAKYVVNTIGSGPLLSGGPKGWIKTWSESGWKKKDGTEVENLSEIKSLYQNLQKHVKGGSNLTITWIPRKKNQRADELSNEARKSFVKKSYKKK